MWNINKHMDKENSSVVTRGRGMRVGTGGEGKYIYGRWTRNNIQLKCHNDETIKKSIKKNPLKVQDRPTDFNVTFIWFQIHHCECFSRYQHSLSFATVSKNHIYII